MALLQMQCTMSLDGFMAGPGGDMSWMADFFGPNPASRDVMNETGALLVGNNTFGGDDPNRGTDKEGAYGGQWDGPVFVVTHHVPDAQVPGVTFVGDLDSGIAAAKAAAGDRYVGVLGADIGRQCIEKGELDEIFVFIAPVLLGDGVRLFDHPGGNKVRLERVDLTQAPQMTGLRLRVVR